MEKCKKGMQNIAQNQSFAQKGVGTKYKTIHIWSYPQNLATSLVKPISAYLILIKINS